jgi:hypothetical protein
VRYDHWMLSKFHVGRVIQSLVREHLEKPKRSHHWPAVRRKHLKESPVCLGCGSHRLLQVHHIVPFSDRPELELDDTNLITLCMSRYECHLFVGHGGDYQCFNPTVLEDCMTLLHHPERRREIELNARVNRKDKP